MVDPAGLDARIPEMGPLIEILLSHLAVERGVVELRPGEIKGKVRLEEGGRMLTCSSCLGPLRSS